MSRPQWLGDPVTGARGTAMLVGGLVIAARAYAELGQPVPETLLAPLQLNLALLALQARAELRGVST